ncbi:FAD-binding domain-containing protein [Xylaria scruposa]|nr:FAD-binding domain-containing protein [Xylaria scruposa]
MARVIFALCYLALFWTQTTLALLSEDLLDVVSISLGPSSLVNRITEVSEAIDKANEKIADLVAPTIAQRAATSCLITNLIFDQNVYTKASPNYTEDEDINWSQTCRLPAACFIHPQSTVEVAIALKVITATGTKFSIRGGGHNPNPGFGSVDSEGVLLDLQDMKIMSIDSNGTLHAGPGHRWIDLYEFSGAHNRTVKGGRTIDVGVPGFILGGGMPFFPALHGLGADSVLNYEIVLANSTVVNASHDQNPELFRALKGGGSNFGIVTRFDIQTYDKIRSQYVVNLYNSSDYLNIFQATMRVQKSMELDPKIDMYVTVTPTVVVVGMFYADWVSQPPPAFDPFYQLESLVGKMVPLTNGTVTSLAVDLGANTPQYDARRIPTAVTTTGDVDLYIQNHENFLKILDTTESTFAANLSYTIQPVASATVREGNARRGNSLGLNSIPQIWWSMVVEWADKKNDLQAQQTLNALDSGLRSIASSRDELILFQFMNDASFMQTVLNSYGSDNLARLRSVATHYDPTAVFQELQNDGFLLHKIK